MNPITNNDIKYEEINTNKGNWQCDFIDALNKSVLTTLHYFAIA